MLGCRLCDTLVDCNSKLCEDDGERLIDVGRYQRLVGKLIYLSLTRPNISFVVGLVSQFMHSPTTVHLEVAYRILQYLKKNLGLGLLYVNNEIVRVEAYTDEDWVGSVSDRRSSLSYFTLVGGNLVTWQSKKQLVVARSKC